MFKSKRSMVNVSIARGALESIFDECDQFDVDETGGRIIGTYQKKDNQYELQVLGVIGPGPNAKRSPASFFQDGEYQERVFRSIEENHPEVEHLGNWHTHHVNGLATLSSGDKTTYQTTVNHHNHNTDFFYALLVVRKAPGRDRRYGIKHYFFRRNDDTAYEIPDAQVRIVDTPVLWPLSAEKVLPSPSSRHHAEIQDDANPERVKDQEFFSEFYPNLKPLFSKSIGAFYWKGRLDLVDGSQADVLAMESSTGRKSSYSITIAGQALPVSDVLARYKNRTFKSARHAVLYLERDINRGIYRNKKE